MKFTTLIAAAALATVSTVAVADVTTATGDLVIVEKNQVFETGAIVAAGTAAAFFIVAASGGTK